MIQLYNDSNVHGSTNHHIHTCTDCTRFLNTSSEHTGWNRLELVGVCERLPAALVSRVVLIYAAREICDVDATFTRKSIIAYRRLKILLMHYIVNKCACLAISTSRYL